jgi:hypothetical protein
VFLVHSWPQYSRKYRYLTTAGLVKRRFVQCRSNGSAGRLCVEALQYNAQCDIFDGAAHYYPTMEAPTP